MLGFANPFMLLALGAVSVPIAIHLFHRLRFRRTSWGAMQFLRRAVQARRRRITLKRLLLLALRVLAVALIAVLFARPFLARPLPGLAYLAGGRAALIVLLDDSASMAQRLDGSTAFEEACQSLSRLAHSVATSRGEFSLTVYVSSREELFFRSDRVTSSEAERLESRLDELQPTPLAFRPQYQLDRLSKRVRALSGEAVVFYLVTDLRASDWAGGDGPSALAPPLERALEDLQSEGRVVLVDVGRKDRSNAGIAQARCIDPLVFSGAPARCELEIGNESSARIGPAGVELLIDGRAVPPVPSPAVPGGERRTVPVDLSLESGFHGLEFRLDREDAFTPDQSFYLAMQSRQSVRALVVDGAPGKRASENASYYLVTALSPDPGDAGTIQVDVRYHWAPEELTLTDYAVVFLCNVAEPGNVRPLRSYLEQGGGLVIFPGDRTRPAAWNRSVFDPQNALVPGRLGEVVGAAEDGASFKLWSLDFAHPLLEPFREWETLFREVRVRQFWRFAPAGNAEVLARYDDPGRAAALVRSDVGEGSVLMFTTTADDSWNNWPRSEMGRITYVPLLHRIVELIAAAQSPDLNPRPAARARVPLDLSRYEHTALLHRPAGEKPNHLGPVRLRAEPREDGPGLWLTTPPLRQAGLWRLDLTGLEGGTESIWLAVNIAEQERRLERMPHRAFQAAAAGPRSLQVVRSEDALARQAATQRRELWQCIAAVLLLLLVTESILSTIFSNPPPISRAAGVTTS